jgi:hypothetical protein
MRSKTRCLLLGSLVSACACVCAAQEFSANVIYFPKGTADTVSPELANHRPSRLFVSKDKIRLETQGTDGAILVVDGDRQETFVLLPAKKQYEPLSSGPSEYFRVNDPENACADWEKAAVQTVKCEKVGDEIVSGRNTVKYLNRGGSDSTVSAVWIDSTLKFVVKWEEADASAELRDVVEGKQPGELFVLPADYEVPKPRKGINKGFSSR